jgi:hypothetical protein
MVTYDFTANILINLLGLNFLANFRNLARDVQKWFGDRLVGNAKNSCLLNRGKVVHISSAVWNVAGAEQTSMH